MLAIPAGPDNAVEPSGPDRGQPTYFLPRRQGWVFRVRVPRDFGKQVLTWTINANGKTEKAYGELLPVEEITERIVMTRGNLNPGDSDPNKPPVLAVAPIAAPTSGVPVSLTAAVTGVRAVRLHPGRGRKGRHLSEIYRARHLRAARDSPRREPLDPLGRDRGRWRRINGQRTLGRRTFFALLLVEKGERPPSICLSLRAHSLLS
jgi:hypothetical protein